ncbi:MAG TPA: hypothetical protein VKM72_33535 [Thermoanaerobaculia bacterium]|nr:hypothetical protein [Thermoanaerobaculia bacterium]
MSVPTDPEWRNLMAAWQSEAPDEAAPPPLSDEVRKRIRRKVRRHSYWLVLLAISEIAMVIGLTAWMVLDVLDLRRPVDLVALIGTVFLFAVAFFYSFRNRRGTWWPAAESTTTFVDLSIERCRRKLRTVRFLPKLLGGGVSFLAVWGTWALLSRPEAPPAARWIEFFGFLILYPAAFLAWGAWYKRKTLRELAEWEELRRSLG